MQFLKWTIFVATIAVCLIFSPRVGAIGVVSPPSGTPKTDSPVLVTGYAFQGAQLYYVQLFNSSDEVVDVSGWTVQYTIPGLADPVVIAHLTGLLKPGGYVVVGNKNTIPTADVLYELQLSPSLTTPLAAIQVLPSTTYLDSTLSVKVDAGKPYWKRNVSTVTGNYLSTFSSFAPDASLTLYGNGFYDYPENTPLQITEILANPRNCSPLETAGDCGDYVKLYNPSTSPVDLSQFRLRVGYQGQTPSSSNTYGLAGLLEPGHYVVIAESEGRTITLTNSGAFAWLEDTYGVMRYDTTIVEYPDASADTKKGQAWAYDSSDGTWKWTAQPTPTDRSSVFPLPVVKAKVAVASTLAPCKEGQYRSEETNRCRSIASDVTALAPCDDDEERNPATNRCRKLASLASTQLTPCKEGQERNPETNRCRNVAAGSPPNAAFGVQQAGDTSKAFVGWWALGGLGVAALGYGAWEWRQEVLKFIQKFGSFFTSAK